MIENIEDESGEMLNFVPYYNRPCKTSALRKLVAAADVCNPDVYASHVSAEADDLEIDSEEVLSSVLKSLIVDYSRDQFSIAGLILIGRGAKLDEAHPLLLDAASQRLSKMCRFLLEHDVKFETKDKDQSKLNEISYLCQYFEGATQIDKNSGNSSIVLQLNEKGAMPAGKQLSLRLVESLLEHEDEMEKIPEDPRGQPGWTRIRYGKGVFRREIKKHYTTGYTSASFSLRVNASWPRWATGHPEKSDIRKIAKDIRGKWKRLACSIRPNSFNAEEISCIESLHPGNYEMQCIAMLKTWNQNELATVENLCIGLLEVGCSAQAEKVFPEAVKELKQEYTISPPHDTSVDADWRNTTVLHVYVSLVPILFYTLNKFLK
eukprot:m.161479 g.161479  ORF g.161479 m.161479 type:complete len:377 (+) comp38819_c1_seq18:2226-3356(+)